MNHGVTAHSAPPVLVVLSGPSGVGKDAVIMALRELHPEFFFAVTATTRPMRPGEIDGQDYIFVSQEEFESLVVADEFLEHAEVYGRRYGVPKDPIRKAIANGSDAIVKVDVQGAATIRSIVPQALLIFLVPPNMPELERRLRERKTESDEQMAIRVETARNELSQAENFDAVVVNETGALHLTVEAILDVISKERHSSTRTAVIF